MTKPSVGSAPSPSPSPSLDGAGPLYAQCAERLSDEIRKGLRAGAHLPSERALADALGFSRLTVRRALIELGEDGIIEPGRRGWKVADRHVSEPPNALISFTEMAEYRGLKASAIVLSSIVRAAMLDEADQLRVAPGSALVEGRRVRLLDGQPIAVETLRLSLVTAPWMSGFDWTTSLHAALDKHGVPPQGSSVLIDVVDADIDEAEVLGVEQGRGLLRLTGTTFDQSGAPLSLDNLRYHPDRYRFRATLERLGGLRSPDQARFVGG